MSKVYLKVPEPAKLREEFKTEIRTMIVDEIRKNGFCHRSFSTKAKTKPLFVEVFEEFREMGYSCCENESAVHEGTTHYSIKIAEENVES